MICCLYVAYIPSDSVLSSTSCPHQLGRSYVPCSCPADYSHMLTETCVYPRRLDGGWRSHSSAPPRSQQLCHPHAAPHLLQTTATGASTILVLTHHSHNPCSLAPAAAQPPNCTPHPPPPWPTPCNSTQQADTTALLLASSPICCSPHPQLSRNPTGALAATRTPFCTQSSTAHHPDCRYTQTRGPNTRDQLRGAATPTAVLHAAPEHNHPLPCLTALWSFHVHVPSRC